MINNKSVLAIITARSGSKGLKNKNILKLNNKPLIAWTIEAANMSQYIDTTIVSTNSKDIAKISGKYNGTINSLRPEELSSDKAKTNDVLIHELSILDKNYDIIILLQPTSPLRKSSDIDDALELLDNKNASSVVSIKKNIHPIEWTINIDSELNITNHVNLNNLKRRQEYEQTYQLNGAIYISYVDKFLSDHTFIREDTLGFVMSNEKSIDIDSEFDFLIASKLINKHE